MTKCNSVIKKRVCYLKNNLIEHLHRMEFRGVIYLTMMLVSATLALHNNKYDDSGNKIYFLIFFASILQCYYKYNLYNCSHRTKKKIYIYFCPFILPIFVKYCKPYFKFYGIGHVMLVIASGTRSFSSSPWWRPPPTSPPPQPWSPPHTATQSN